MAAQILPLDWAPNDPLSAYLLSAGGVVDLERLKLDSPVLSSLREAGVKLVAPLTGQGEVEMQKTVVDPRLQWRYAGNVWHNALIRTVINAPVRWVRKLGK